MTRRWLAVLIVVLAAIAGCGDGGSGAQDTAGKTGSKLNVVTTTGQVGDLVRNVGGDRVTVISLMGPGIDPHLYKASAGDVERLRRADVIFFSGLHLEAKMGEVIEKLGARQPTVAVTAVIPDELLLSPDNFPGAHDPHVWFDLELWGRTIAPVAAKLAELDPAHADEYRQRAAAYAAEFEVLHAYALEQFATIPAQQRVLVTAHDAFNYLGRAYGLEVRGLQGISTATEAGTGDVQDLAAFIAERRIPALFVETSVSPRAIEAVRNAVRARGFDVIVGGEVYSDALGDPGTPAGTYLGMVRHNIDTITRALRGEGNHEQH